MDDLIQSLAPDAASGAIPLTGLWQLSDTEGGNRCALRLPGDGISALVDAGLAPEPYWGRNEARLRWIGERDWVARRAVTLADPKVDLVVSGLDTVAEIRWNGQLVLATENQFRSYRAPLAGIARAGANEVEITFRSPVREAAKRQAAQPYPVPYTFNYPIPDGNMLRKVQCDFGWDWNVALTPFGLDGDIRLEPAGAARIDRLIVTQDHAPGRVSVTIDLATTHADGAPARAELCGKQAEAVIRDGRATLRLTIADPALWWPAGQGPQILHDLTVTAGAARATRRIGLREIRLVTEPDAAGAGFAFRVNGRDIFAKGANWIPADALAGRITSDKTRALLDSAAAAHMNMIRVWGGGRYEADDFYDACDEIGLMVWQDFMFACSLYPATPDFLAEVAAEAREQVARLQHHACIALWCGDNELVGALSWYPESRANRDRYLVAYDRLNRTVETALRETDPNANWWPSSPSRGPLDFGDGWHEPGRGDMHVWAIWHEGRDFAHYRDIAPRFVSEFGFQSYPSMPVIESFTTPADRNIASPILESHQKNPGGNARIAETMFRYFRWPERFADFVWLSQIQQGLAIQTAVSHWRSLRPHCMGTLYWQLNDTWPGCSWSSLDYGGGWKLLHYMAARFYAPLMVTARPEGDDIALIAVNDAPRPATLRLTVRAVTPAGGLRALGAAEARIATGAQSLLRLPGGTLGADEILVFDWEDEAGTRGRDLYAPQPWKAYDLPDPGLRLAVEGDRLRLRTERLALFVTAEADAPGRFDDNVLMLLPGEERLLRFLPDAPGTPARFGLRDLASATRAGVAQSISG